MNEEDQIVAAWCHGASTEEIARQWDLTPSDVTALLTRVVLGTLVVAPVIEVSPALARHLRQHLMP
jgi:hypothetical protein